MQTQTFQAVRVTFLSRLIFFGRRKQHHHINASLIVYLISFYQLFYIYLNILFQF